MPEPTNEQMSGRAVVAELGLYKHSAWCQPRLKLSFSVQIRKAS